MNAFRNGLCWTYFNPKSMNTHIEQHKDTRSLLNELGLDAVYEIGRDLIDRLHKLGVLQSKEIYLEDFPSSLCTGPVLARGLMPSWGEPAPLKSNSITIASTSSAKDLHSYSLFDDRTLQALGCTPFCFDVQEANQWFIDEIEAKHGGMRSYITAINQAVNMRLRLQNLV